ncbi:MAG: glycosyltransferase [Planctomycetota bacterium]
MARCSTRKVAFISSYPPRQCGIATFTSDLIANTAKAAGGEFEPLVVAMQGANQYRFSEPVKFEIRTNVKNDYLSAADFVNFSHVDVVCVQHEFGLFGGDGGAYLGLLLSNLNAPIVTTLHTILIEPGDDYFKSMVAVCELSEKVIVMNKRGVSMLENIYGVPKKKIQLIPHGIPDLPFVDSNYYKHQFNMDGRKTILTFGLLSKNKGIEVMLSAMPRIIAAHPSVLYIVLGMTHPEVIRHDGESYRFMLQRMVKDLKLQDHVIFHNRFVTDEKLHNFLCAADLYVTPYLAREQLTSGTLAYAVGAGNAVVSTPYWAAEELLAEGRGMLVRFGDSKHIAEAIIELFDDSSLFYSKRRKAYDFGRAITWPKIGQAYWKLFSAKYRGTPAGVLSAGIHETVSVNEVPEPRLDHMLRLTDDTGLFQHAKFTIPDRGHGYCTDDNARAAIAMARYYDQYADAEALRLFDTYLSFICHSQRSEGTIHNFMDFDRCWRKNEPVHDAMGRVLWAFGTVMAKPPSASYLPVMKDFFDRSVGHTAALSARGMAYAIVGMSDYLKQFPGASAIKRQLIYCGDSLTRLYETNSTGDWQWFENKLTYDNAILPCALFAAFLTLGEEKYLEVAKTTCDFLLKNIFNGYHFSFIGCNGWYPRGGQRAAFDQQPIEVASLVMMLGAAYEALNNREFLVLRKKAFDWFLGDNDLHIPLYDFKTKGCCDGLGPGGANLNQGAESTVSFLLAVLCVLGDYTGLDKGRYGLAGVEETTLKGQVEIRTQIESISTQTAAGKAAVKKLT